MHPVYKSGMKLDTYMTQRGLKDDGLALMLGVSRASVSRLRRGKQRPSYELALKLKEVTKGRVTANDFLPAETTPEREGASA